MSEAVKVERHGAVAVLRLDDPGAMNALSPAIKAGMEKSVAARSSPMRAVRAIIITGPARRSAPAETSAPCRPRKVARHRPCAPACR